MADFCYLLKRENEVFIKSKDLPPLVVPLSKEYSREINIVGLCAYALILWITDSLSAKMSTCAEGKKIGWTGGVWATWCILQYNLFQKRQIH